jgi:hypothetical protein
LQYFFHLIERKTILIDSKNLILDHIV